MIQQKFIGQRVITRGRDSGVYYGTLTARKGRECVLTNTRNIWSWSGAASLFQLATEGVKRPGCSKFTVYVDEVVLTDVIEILPCTEAAIKNIESVESWKV